MFMKKVYKRTYMINYSSCYNSPIVTNGCNRLTNWGIYDGYYIKHYDEFINHIKIYETDVFESCFSYNDKICINNEILNIDEIIIDISQKNSYIYIVDKYEIIEDKESYDKAEKDIEELRRIIEERNLELNKKQLINKNREKWFAGLAEELKNWH